MQTIFSLYEHQTLRLGNEVNGVKFTQHHLEALENYYGNGTPYFALVNKGIKATEYVGVINVDDIVIEVLPKADKDNNFDRWRKVLIGMLKTVGAFRVSSPSSADLSIKRNYLLDLYFEMYIKEINYLVRTGLVKKYRTSENNQKALKGKLMMSKHLQKNIIHKERFYVSHTVYDQQHEVHQILYKALQLVYQLNNNPALNVRATLFSFPEMKDLKVSHDTFDKIALNRKLKPYEKALDIARLLLLNYHPDLTKGGNDVLALMFDMNALWERFVLISLQRKLTDYKIKGQTSKLFWVGKDRGRSYMRPDILMEHKENNQKIVLDTKWKHIQSNTPNPSDLRQMFAYSQFFDAEKVALIYPGLLGVNKGHYKWENDVECGVLQIGVDEDLGKFVGGVVERVREFCLS
ncbi:McrC family protein [Flammeovirga yaeyamensis]|uniref:McrC family protein n=1 Tax=Flammeovirga yaeyamensis TaxID=367791 RepID=A0AAX1MZH9_9BACT|nr:restriction endonuclease [Flammeovirga yaeyamensis]MBB3695937.1 5-methylcytosine-specific restriction enzyme subunit McrC [Flammeovirga yaeyamensis]NMF34625.1 restriction endonuclease [Flammeovirga yaeyamensis]QWG00546.1 McrC family protein [Flammeovirga yaeyamensis]